MAGIKPYKIGVVIPTYCERENIIQLLDSLRNTLESSGYRYHILVVDDNSPDGTAEAVREYGNRVRGVEVVVRPGKMGLGSAIRDGMRRLLGDSEITHIVTMDADFSHNPGEMPRLLSKAGDSDLVIGSRYVRGGKALNWGFHRRLISWGANTLIRLLYRTGVKDHTSNYRVYSRRAVEDIVKLSRENGYEWVIEALLILHARGYRIAEVPITFTNRKAGRSKLGLRDILAWLFFMLKYRERYKRLKRENL
ncbi:MAG: polyprenol monophosphomannose synthase [Thermoprotei archaeon]